MCVFTSTLSFIDTRVCALCSSVYCLVYSVFTFLVFTLIIIYQFTYCVNILMCVTRVINTVYMVIYFINRYVMRVIG